MEKLIIQAKDLSAVVVPGSLLLGVCWLIGTCWALGPNAFGFISVADVVRSALWFCPVQIVTMTFVLTLREAFPVLKGGKSEVEYVADLSSERKKLRMSIAIVFLILIVGVFLLVPTLFYVLLVFLGIYISYAVIRYSRASDRETKMPLFSKLLILMLGACFQVTLLAYGMTGAIITMSSYGPSESICVNKECSDGTVIKRFSEATYVRWASNNHLTILLNSEVTSIVSKRELSDAPLFDTRPFFAHALNWLLTSDTLPEGS
ncbi:hypothetical protein ABIC60_002646 [Phyllobacterium ifriqiyense]